MPHFFSVSRAGLVAARFGLEQGQCQIPGHF
jgi:hypothetical protein